MFSNQPLYLKKWFILNIFFIIIFFVIVLRIIYLVDIFSKTDKSKKNIVVRGAITDRNGVHLAITEEASSILIKPDEILDPEFTAKYLAGYLDLNYEEILQKIYLNQNRKSFLLERKIDNYISELILDLNLPGVYKNHEYKRIYPSNRLASNLIGFVRRDNLEGLSGLEAIYNDILNTSIYDFYGPTLELTIDSLIQNEFDKVLLDYFEASKAQKAIGIMMDLKTGEILALSNFPDYDPNFYYKENVKEKHNWAFSFPFEPGSIMKPFFVAMVLNDYPELQNHKVECKGEFRFKSGSVRCLRNHKIVAHGLVDLEKIIEVSCNVGIIQFAKFLDKNHIYKYLLELGFGQKTGIVPSSWEHAGYLPRLDHWVESTQYYFPIGQGLSATPIQLIKAFSALINGGILLDPVIVKRIYSKDKVIFSFVPQMKTTSFRKKSLNSLQNYLLKVVEKGTGKLAKVNFVNVIGKTGTSQKSAPYGYTNLYTASFIGAFPYPNPKYSVLIIFDGVSEEYSGGNLSALAFSKFLNQIKKILFLSDSIQRINLKEKIPYKKIYFEDHIVPNFKDFSLREVIQWKEEILDPYNQNHNRSIFLEIYGGGYVVKQIPEQNTDLKEISKIQIYLSEENF